MKVLNRYVGMFAVFFTLSSLYLIGEAKASWWNNSYAYRSNETLKTESAANFGNTPYLVNGSFGLNASGLIATGKIRNDCKDLVLVNGANNTKLTYEWEDYANATYGCNSSRAVLWANSSILADNTTVNSWYYGDVYDADWHNTTAAVFDTSYLEVLHLGNSFRNSGQNQSHTAALGGAVGGNISVGRFGYGYNFSDDGSWLRLGGISGSEFTSNSPFTLEMWLNPSTNWVSGHADQRYIFSDYSGQRITLIYNSSGFLKASLYPSVGDISYAVNMNNNTWYYVAVTFSAGNLRLYLNGSEVASALGTESWTYYSNDWQINCDNSGQCFDGIIDEFRLSNVDRGADYIKQQYNYGLASLSSEETTSVTPGGESYAAGVFEYEYVNFFQNVTVESGTTLDSANLVWNGTNYTYSSFKTFNSTLWEIGKTLQMPDISGPWTTADFYWNITVRYFDGTSDLINTTVHTQTIYEPQMKICNSTDQRSRKFAFYNETSDFGVANGTMDAYIRYYESSGHEYSLNFTATNTTYWVCIYPGWANFTADGHIQYRGNNSGDYSIRDYFLDNDEFSNNSAEFPLYLLPTSLGTRVTITVKDEYSNAYKGIIVHIERYYPHLNTYKTVASVQTDDAGKTNTYLVLYDVYYRFKIQLNGILLDTIAARLITDTALELVVSPGAPIEWLEYWGAIKGSCAYTESTGYISCDYTDSTNAYLNNATLTVQQIGALKLSEVCSNTNTSHPSGIIKCYLGNATGKKFAYELVGKLFNSDEFMILQNTLEQGAYVSILFGSCKEPTNVAACKEGVILAFFLSLTCALIGVYNPTASMVLMLIGVFASAILGLFAISLYSIIGLMFVAGVIIYAMQRREPI